MPNSTSALYSWSIKNNENFLKLKGIFRDPLSEVLFSYRTHTDFFVYSERTLYNTNLASRGLLQKQSSINKIGKSLHF